MRRETREGLFSTKNQIKVFQMKTKPLLPTLRERKRYLVYRVHSDTPLDGRTVAKAITSEAMSYLGVKGFSEAGLIPLHDKWDADSQTGIIRVTHTSVEPLKAALTFVRRIDGQDVIVRSVSVSGILKKATERFAG